MDKFRKQWLIFASIPFGAILGFLLHPSSKLITELQLTTWLPWIRLPGDIFLSLLQMIMVPMVVASISVGISKLENSFSLLQLGIKTAIYFVFTTIFATNLGIILANLIQPGKGILNTSMAIVPETSRTINVTESILGIIPKNIFQSLTQTNMLSLVFLGILLGLFFIRSKSKETATFREVFVGLESFCHWVVHFTLYLAPLAIVSLLSASFAKLGTNLLSAYGRYILTVLIGLFLLLSFYSVLVFLTTKTNPFVFLKKIKSVLSLAFSTSSSSSILPVTLSTAKENLAVRESVADFVIPLGATVNMDGTALYQGIAALFLAQIFGVSLSFLDQVVLLFTVTGASIGTAATPGAGIIILGGILQSFGIPMEGIAILLGVDRFLDMCRTSVNVAGDLTASLVINQWWKP